MNLCKESVDPCEIMIEVDESSGQSLKKSFEYELIPFNNNTVVSSTMPLVFFSRRNSAR